MLPMICVLAVVVMTTNPAEASEPSLPAPVTKDLKAIADQCTEAGGKPQAASAVKRADLNGDGKEDFILDVGSISCEGAASIYGDREKAVSVYAGDGSAGAALVFSDMVFGAKLEGAGPAAKLWLSVSGAGCGKKPAADFASESFCERPLQWNSKTNKLEYAPVSTVKMIQ